MTVRIPEKDEALWSDIFDCKSSSEAGRDVNHYRAARADQAQKDSVRGMSNLGTISNNFLNKV